MNSLEKHNQVLVSVLLSWERDVQSILENSLPSLQSSALWASMGKFYWQNGKFWLIWYIGKQAMG